MNLGPYIVLLIFDRTNYKAKFYFTLPPTFFTYFLLDPTVKVLNPWFKQTSFLLNSVVLRTVDSLQEVTVQ